MDQTSVRKIEGLLGGVVLPTAWVPRLSEEGAYAEMVTRVHSTGFCGIDIYSLHLVPCSQFLFRYACSFCSLQFLSPSANVSVLSFRPSL